MAKPNYGYEKRQRELEKKRRKEDKARAKIAGRAGAGTEALDAAEPGAVVAVPDEGAAPGAVGNDGD